MTRLSSHTWIEDGYCYTTSREVASAWRYVERLQMACDDMSDIPYVWGTGNWNDVRAWRIPIASLPEVYGCREGEPFVWVTEYVYVGENFERDMDFDTPMLHLRAVIPCDGSADSLRALYEEVQRWFSE